MRSVKQKIWLPHEVVYEILTWLPAKSLMRFLCVSRLWCTTICDSDFAEIHRVRCWYGSRSRSFLLEGYSNDKSCESHEGNSYYTASISPEGPVLNLLNLPYFGFERITEVVNGLTCLYRETDNLVSLFNLSTREVQTLPTSTIRRRHCKYHFGFDPIEEKYKLLALFWGYPQYKAEVLTLGTSSWRIAGVAPRFFVSRRSLCLNGKLYLTPREKTVLGFLAFDLKTEVFILINRPNGCINGHIQLVQLGASLAAIRIFLRSSRAMSLWILDDKGDSMTWIFKYKIELPEVLCCTCVPTWIGTLPTGEMLLTAWHIKFPMPIYSYNHTTREIKKMEINNYPSFFPSMKNLHFSKKKKNVHWDPSSPWPCLFHKRAKPNSRISYHQENIISLSHLTRGM